MPFDTTDAGEKEMTDSVKTKNHYIYSIMQIGTGKFYVGMRSTYKNPDDDDYWGSGTIITRMIKKYGKECFRKEILIRDIINREALVNFEKKIITVDLMNDPLCLNLKTGGLDGIVMSEETRKKISRSLTGKRISEETRKKISDANKKRSINNHIVGEE